MIELLISVVVIEYHSVNEIKAAILSIESACKNIAHEIIVSSNSCYPLQKQRELAAMYPKIQWVFNERNGGFAYGMNCGLKRSRGKYQIIMNPDVKIESGLYAMIKFMDKNKNIGAIAPQIIGKNGAIQDSCRPYVSLQGFVWRSVKRIFLGQKSALSSIIEYSKIQTVDWVIGAFILIRKEAYFATKGLDDGYFMYAEDLDWCTRIRQKGFEIVYFPHMKIIYEGSRSARRSKKYALIFIRSHMRYWKKFGFFGGYPIRKQQIFSME